MNYRFTDRVRKALARAREEALKLGHDYVGTEHILLGLAAQAEAQALLGPFGVTEGDVRERVRRKVREGPGRVRHGELPYTSLAKKVLELTMAESRRQGDSEIRLRHLLAGLMGEERFLSAHILRELGVTPERLADGAPAAGVGRGTSMARPVWFLEIDADDGPIYEQIVARVEEAVATGRLEPGERLPTVRQLAEELGVAPGTVARSYSELERRGVLETAGARGTRVATRASPAAGTAPVDDGELAGLLRPAAIAAFHMGASADQLRRALDRAMEGILR